MTTIARARISALLCVLLVSAAGLSGQVRSLAVTYLYDNTTAVPGVKANWGFSCLVETEDRKILFDTGAKADVLKWNIARLGIDLSGLDAVVFSHTHDDHTGGPSAVGAHPGIPIYMPLHSRLSGFISAAIDGISARRVPVTGDAVQAFPWISVQGEMQGAAWEDCLTVDTPRGLVVIVGCAHPGIIPMLEKIRKTTGRPIHMVIGGFHLLSTPPDETARIVAGFKALGVQYAGPTHCTGDLAMELFREAYGGRFIRGGVGTVIRVNGE